MGSLRGCPGAALAPLLLLGFPVLCLAGLREPGPTIDGRPLASCTLREKERRAFICRAPQAAPGSVLTWYLDGRRQEANCSAAGTASSTLTITARRTDRELNCSVTDPASNDTANASVLLDVQYKPEILRADARYEEVDDAGLLLVLFVLVQANPPASITWVDQDGRIVANASEFLLLDTKHYPGLANHSLHVHLGRAATNLSVSAANSLGITTTSLLPPGLLDAHVELPFLGVAVGSALALSALLGLGSLAACLACRRAKPVPGLPGSASVPPRAEHLQTPSTCLPRENRSLPPDLRLGELTQEHRGKALRHIAPMWAEKLLLCPLSFPTATPGDVEAKGGQRTLQNTLVLSEGVQTGLVPFPMAGRIYKVPSMSSDEIWL
ncbi:transmembrane protein 25 isoform X3 [Cygnus olor]|uniref:transmembrane protein 25 isoform X3 n=1 Tax=Cygnus olor TaxID=8869 RepID=UPI001ADE5ED9|nr:transmembrane protein 25 isoform X3 [Cygnus olor]XP_040390359.1 transmembrane protein 25 isoform X3 [Cygnus olor]